MRDRSDRYQVPAVPVVGKTQSRSVQAAQAALRRKRLGDYLVEAGLLTPAQIDVALNDQQMTQMKFGEILAARGWVKQQTVEFLMAKVVLPERRAVEQRERDRRVQAAAQTAAQVAQGQAPAARPMAQPASAASNQAFVRRDVPISKPLPPVKSTDGDVNWVG